MNPIKTLFIVSLVLSSINFGQKLDYNKILNKTKNINAAYLNDNSMLLKLKDKKLKLIDLISTETKEIEIEGFVNYLISQTKEDFYFLTRSIGEQNDSGVLISRSGEKTIFPISTYYAKISVKGDYIITTQSSFDGGKFQAFATKTLEKIILPKRNYSTFIAEFIDANRVFYLYHGKPTAFNNLDIESLKEENLRKAQTNEISMGEFEQRRSELVQKQKARISKRGIAKFKKTTSFMIYNLTTQQILFETELKIDSTKYQCSNELYEIGISEDGSKVLASARRDNDANSYHNRLIEIDISTNKMIDISRTFGLVHDDSIEKITFINDGDFVLSIMNKGKVKYFYSTRDSLYSIVREFGGGGASIESILPEDDLITIVSHRNNKYIWDYKNGKIIEGKKSYPIFSIDGKMIKTNEVLE